jgi:hypothetical protein
VRVVTLWLNDIHHKERSVMPAGYDVLTGLLVAFIVIAMIGGSFGRSHP